MKQQLSLFLARRHKTLRSDVAKAEADYAKACRRHFGQGRAHAILLACRKAQLRFETKHGLTATPRAAKTRDKAA